MPRLLAECIILLSMTSVPLHPFSVSPRVVEVVWGGQRLAKLLDRALPTDRPIGETWEVHDDDLIEDGPFTGQSLAMLARAMPGELLGSRSSGRDPRGPAFPLLLKFIDAAGTLSVQVHPDDVYAGVREAGQLGKTESWYILSADPGAKLYAGLRDGIDRVELASAISENRLEPHLMSFAVQPGDVIYMPAGTVHAIGAGVTLLELQQSSTITYRLYDWGRLGSDGKARTLHIAQSLDVILFPQPTIRATKGLRVRDANGERILLTVGPYFLLEQLVGRSIGNPAGQTFHLLTNLDDETIVDGETFGQRVLGRCQTLIIPAAAGQYTVTSATGGALLRSSVPDLHEDVVAPARRAGYSDTEIAMLGDLTSVLGNAGR